MTFDSQRRVHDEEILDAGTASDADVRMSLDDLARINAYLGGRRVLFLLLREQLRRTGLKTFSLLDAGSGGGDLPAAVARWFRPRGYQPRVISLDRQWRHLRLAARFPQEQQPWPVCGDVQALPFAAGSFDFVSASLFLHHFEDAAAVEVLRNLAGVARHALLVNDLERHALAYHFIRWTPFFARSPVTRFDGAVSVQRAFRVHELEDLARRAGLSRCRARRHLPFRLSLVTELP